MLTLLFLAWSRCFDVEKVFDFRRAFGGDIVLFSRTTRDECGFKFAHRNSIHKRKSISDLSNDEALRKNPRETGDSEHKWLHWGRIWRNVFLSSKLP